MSIETLKADFAANTADLARLDPLASTADVISFLKNTIWPFQENIITELEEQDSAIQDLVDGIEDVISQDTAGVLAAPIVAGRVLIAKLKTLIPATAKDQHQAIKEWEKMAKAAEETIQEIVVLDPVDGDGADDEDDESDDDELDDDKED